MLRQLLTLMAVICGFTLSAAPVQASPTSVVSVVQAAERGDCIVQGSRPIQLVEVSATGPAARRPCERTVLIVQVPTVMLRIDRAHE